MPKCEQCGAYISRGNFCLKCYKLSTAKGGKYGNVRIKTRDGTFDSKLELRRWFALGLMEHNGEIKNLRRQVRYDLIDKSDYGKAISYVADFVYEKDDKTVVEDTKSSATKTPLYRLKKRLMAERYGIKIKEITDKDI